MAAQLYTVPGVKSVKVDTNRRTIIVVPQAGKVLSPRQLCEAGHRQERDRAIQPERDDGAGSGRGEHPQRHETLADPPGADLPE